MFITQNQPPINEFLSIPKLSFLGLKITWILWFLFIDPSQILAQGSGQPGGNSKLPSFEEIIAKDPDGNTWKTYMNSGWNIAIGIAALMGGIKVIRALWKLNGRNNGEGISDLLTGGALLSIAGIIGLVKSIYGTSPVSSF